MAQEEIDSREGLEDGPGSILRAEEIYHLRKGPYIGSWPDTLRLSAPIRTFHTVYDSLCRPMLPVELGFTDEIAAEESEDIDGF